MIEASTQALSLKCDAINIFLLNKLLNNNIFSQNFFSIKNLHLNKISFFESKLLRFGFLSKNIKKKIEFTDIIFVHNSDLLKIFRTYFPLKKIILFFHTDKLNQIIEFKYADKVLTVNKTMEKRVNSIYLDKAIYLPNCLNKLYKYNNKKTLSKKNKNSVVIGAMGRLVKKKGFEFLIKNCLKIENVELLIAGDGEESNNLKKLSENHKNIKLLGWVKSKEKFFDSIDVFCSSSNIEPFGLVILEAMARGIPVVSTKCNGPIDIIKNNKDGLLVEINNSIELKNAIIKLKNSKMLRKKLGLNAFNKYNKKFTFNEYKKNIGSILNQL